MSTNTAATHRGRASETDPGGPAQLAASGDSSFGFWLAALVAVVGVTTAAVWAVAGVLDQTQQPAGFVRADVPGSASVVLTQVGAHVVYYEGGALEGGDDRAALTASELVVTGANGATVDLRPYPGDLRYDVPGRPGALGTAIAVFDADRTGPYTVETQATAADPDARLAVGDDLAPATVRAVVLPALAALVSVLAAIALAVRTWTRRNRRFPS